MLGNTYCRPGLMAAVLLVALCCGCAMSTEKTMYDIGVKAMKNDPAFPQGATAVAAPRARCAFYVGKSAASVDIPYSAGGTVAMDGTYVVWLKRIGTRWEFDRATAVPKRP